MRDVNLDKLTADDLIDHAGISEAFKNYLMEVLGYDEGDADFVVKNDFANPYETPYIIQQYVRDVEVNGKKYEVRSCHTDFCACGMFHLADKKPFEFYMFIDCETLTGGTVGDYINSRKMYLI